ncbi:hypothetical protein [Microbacterium sp.]|uniref:deoxynucleotide monophosphate kinase family protein n=1 Tax=Microbacterium sp. TaxID=51671 RepID=UPI003242A0EB
MTLPLIGFVGRKRSGKDTAAKTLVAEFGYSAAAFADPLRDHLAAVDPIVGIDDGRRGVPWVRYSDAVAELGYDGAKDRYPELRRLLQTEGTDGVRDTLGTKYGLRELLDGHDVWTAIAQLRIDRALQYEDIATYGGSPLRRVWRELLAFTDVRFLDEAAIIRDNGGVLVRIIRPSTDSVADAHRSETELDLIEVDHEVVNDGTLDDLAAKVRAIVT